MKAPVGTLPTHLLYAPRLRRDEGAIKALLRSAIEASIPDIKAQLRRYEGDMKAI